MFDPAFLLAISQNPTDDSIRLVFADWVRQNCPDHCAFADLINAQIYPSQNKYRPLGRNKNKRDGYTVAAQAATKQQYTAQKDTAPVRAPLNTAHNLGSVLIQKR